MQPRPARCKTKLSQIFSSACLEFFLDFATTFMSRSLQLFGDVQMDICSICLQIFIFLVSSFCWGLPHDIFGSKISSIQKQVYQEFQKQYFLFSTCPDALACLAGMSTISRCIVYLEMGLLDFPSSDVSLSMGKC